MIWAVDESPRGPLQAVGTEGSEQTLAHELGHMFGLRHSNTADVCDAVDPASPWPENFSNARTQEHGYDVEAYELKLGFPVAVGPKFDLMSYCEQSGTAPH